MDEGRAERQLLAIMTQPDSPHSPSSQLDWIAAMPNARLVFFVVAAWITPPLVAGALGWIGVWGSGSAFVDYLIPIPVAGGALHVPSFLVAAFAVASSARGSDAGAANVRAVVLGAALVGVAMGVDVERVYVAATTDVSLSRIPWQQNPLGLFVLSDSVWAWVCMAHRPPLAAALGRTAVIAIALPALYIASVVMTDRHVDDPFVMGQSRNQPERGDEVRWVYVRLPVTDPTFRTAALAWVEGFRPEDDMNVEDVAFHFTDSLDTAKGSGRSAALATLCLHEDGTPDLWLAGGGDCFSDHVTFSDRVAALGVTVPRDVPRDVAAYLTARTLCADVPRSEVVHPGLAADSFCEGIDLGQTHRRLEEAYGADRLAEWTGAFE